MKSVPNLLSVYNRCWFAKTRVNIFDIVGNDNQANPYFVKRCVEKLPFPIGNNSQRRNRNVKKYDK